MNSILTNTDNTAKAIKTFDRLRVELGSLKENARAANTLKAYKSDFKHFSGWCEENGFNALPSSPEAVALYLTDIRDQFKLSTLERRLASISGMHKQLGEEPPTQSQDIKDIIKGIRREKTKAQNQASPLLTSHLRIICQELTDEPIDVRDRALLLLGFASGLRRAGLTRIDSNELKYVDEGVVVNLKKSKTDQEGQGREIGVSYGSNPETCPVRSLKKWLTISGIESGPLFRSIDKHGNIKSKRLSGKAVNRIVKKRVRQVGLDPKEYSSHSLRAGLVTQAAMNGTSTISIMDQTGHKTERMVRKYYRSATLFDNNASSGLGL